MIAVGRSELRRVLVAIDPATTHGEEADDTGIIVVARGPHKGDRCQLQSITGRCPGHGYVLADLTCHVAPHEWARRAIDAYDRWDADRIVAEVNNGGDMVGETIHAVRAGVSYLAVNASRGKRIRAEPVAALDEQGRLHYQDFPRLVDELVSWTQDAGWSPNRLDALVWGCTALGLIGSHGTAIADYMRRDIQAANQPRGIADRKERSRMRQIKAIMSRGLRFDKPREAGNPKCEHRWRDRNCVFCQAPQP